MAGVATPTTTSDAARTTGKPGSTSENEPGTTALLSVGAPVKSETKRDKAVRLLVTGRLRVLRVDADFIFAECRGDSGEVYNVSWRDQRWSCSCPARTDCSHLAALWCVVAVNRR